MQTGRVSTEMYDTGKEREYRVIECTRRLICCLEVYKQHLFMRMWPEDAVQRDRGNAPSGWSVPTLEELCIRRATDEYNKNGQLHY